MSTFDSLNAKWTDFRPSKTQAFWFAAGCVGATLAIGFGSAGWVTAATAEKRVAQAAEEARVQLAAAVCVDQFMEAANAPGRLAKLQDLTWYARSEQITKAGWATMPDQKAPDTSVAIACASQLSEMPVAEKH